MQVNKKRYSWYDLDLLLDNDPIKLRDLAYELQDEADQAKRLLFKLIQEVERGRTAVNEVIYHAERLFDETN